jgi:DNA-binding MarR family transcriptional regulator
MTDINDSPRLAERADGDQAPRDNGQTRAGVADSASVELAELLFFAYRDFISDPDTELAQIGYGRAHHRVLHFVSRHPGLRVADLLDILKITKQSLGRVLKQLIDEGYVEQKAGQADKRERLLFGTARGQALASRLIAPQLARIAQALTEGQENGDDSVRRFLNQMISDQERGKVATLLGTGRPYQNGALERQ